MVLKCNKHVYCDVTKLFWTAFCTWLAECKIGIDPLKILDVLFGVHKRGKDFTILNHLILSAKFYIYKCKSNSVSPSLQVFKVKTRAVFQIKKKKKKRNSGKAGKKNNEKCSKLVPHVSE